MAEVSALVVAGELVLPLSFKLSLVDKLVLSRSFLTNLHLRAVLLLVKLLDLVVLTSQIFLVIIFELG